MQLDPHRCNFPAQVINIDPRGKLYLCICESWSPTSVGHVMDFDSMQAVFASAAAKKLQGTINDGSYSMCHIDQCGIAQHMRMANLPTIYVGIDDSCQLSCPSCRRDIEFDTTHTGKQAWVERILQWIELSPVMTKVLVGAHGDPLVSGLYQQFLHRLCGLPVLVQIKTNGLLLQSHMEYSGIWPQVTELSISIDAATPEVYHQLRRPAHWNQLIKNLDYMQELRSRAPIRLVRANFVVQQANLRDMPAFVDLCDKYDMEPNFTMLEDWGVLDDFARHQADPRSVAAMSLHPRIKPHWRMP